MAFNVNIKDVREQADWLSNTKGPEVVIQEGYEALVYNADLDLPGANPDMVRWAKRWGPILRNEGAVVVNSALDKREWAELDAATTAQVKLRRNLLADMDAAGLVTPISLAVILSQWRVASERIRPSVNIDGESSAQADRTGRKTYSTPVPIFRTDFGFSKRELMAGRALGDALDTFEAGEAAASIVEEQERMVFLGESSVVVEGNAIPGLTTFTARDTDTATNYGGGVFSTVGNGYKTVLGMVSALAAKRYHGPFNFYVAAAEYLDLLNYYTDGSNSTDLQRILTLPQVSAVKPSDYLAAGNAVLVQMTPDVLDYREAMRPENREWMDGAKTKVMFAAMAAGVHRLKQDSQGYTGIAHCTGAA